ncbi:hypothetical protein GCM10010353_42780 [Streptomyces chryseus]|nr:hypothetical protein GCM10010353_42780 [Streptomyces chryseus]
MRLRYPKEPRVPPPANVRHPVAGRSHPDGEIRSTVHLVRAATGMGGRGREQVITLTDARSSGV